MNFFGILSRYSIKWAHNLHSDSIHHSGVLYKLLAQMDQSLALRRIFDFLSTDFGQISRTHLNKSGPKTLHMALFNFYLGIVV